MPGQWWMMSGMTVAASVAMGLGLGSYVTSPQKTAVSAEEWSADDDNSYVEPGRAASMFGDSGTGDRGPAVIRCTGCGPTLTERRFAADMAGMEGSSDPYVQDYLVDTMVKPVPISPRAVVQPIIVPTIDHNHP